MIITVSGVPGSGKSTIARTLARRLGFRHYSNGDFMRQMAKERGIKDFTVFSEMAKSEPEIDREIDRRCKRVGETEDDFVLDGRLAWHFIPGSVKVFLDVSLEEGASRIFRQKRKEEASFTMEEAMERVRKRMASERERYRKLYNLDCYDKSHYDFVLDTTGLAKKQVLDKVLGFIKSLGGF